MWRRSRREMWASGRGGLGWGGAGRRVKRGDDRSSRHLVAVGGRNACTNVRNGLSAHVMHEAVVGAPEVSVHDPHNSGQALEIPQRTPDVSHLSRSPV